MDAMVDGSLRRRSLPAPPGTRNGQKRWVRILSRRSLFRKALFLRRISRVGSPVPPLPPPSSFICKDGEAMAFDDFYKMPTLCRKVRCCHGEIATWPCTWSSQTRRLVVSLSAHFLLAADSPPSLSSPGLLCVGSYVIFTSLSSRWCWYPGKSRPPVVCRIAICEYRPVESACVLVDDYCVSYCSVLCMCNVFHTIVYLFVAS